MNVSLNAWHEQHHCTWCEKQKECVSVSFEDGFLKNAPLCWGCLQKAVRVRSRQQDKPATKPQQNL